MTQLRDGADYCRAEPSAPGRIDQLRVLHISTGLSVELGGPPQVVQQLTTALTKLGVDCSIAACVGELGRSKAGIRGLPIPGVNVHMFETSPLADVWSAHSGAIARFLRDQIDTYDLVHVHELWHHPGFAAFRAARSEGVPFVLTPHGALEDWSLRHKALKKRIYMWAIQDRILRTANMLHALSESESKRIAELGYETPVAVVPNGVDGESYYDLPDTREFLEKYPLLVGRKVLLFLGRLHVKKGLDILARSFTKIATRFPNVALLVVGPDEHGNRYEMEAVLREAGVLDQVVFTGTLTGREKLASMGCADVFVLPSYSEGFSMATLEAMAAGLPVVISDKCNFPEVAEHDAGFVVSVDEVGVTDAIVTLLSDGELRRRKGANGRELVRNQYSWDSAAAKMMDLYSSIVDTN